MAVSTPTSNGQQSDDVQQPVDGNVSISNEISEGASSLTLHDEEQGDELGNGVESQDTPGDTKAGATGGKEELDQPKIEDDEEDKYGFDYEVYKELRGRDIYDKEPPNLELRRYGARKRLLQAASYHALVEDRIIELEGQLKQLQEQVDKAEAGGTDETEKKAALDAQTASPDEVPTIYSEAHKTLKASATKMMWNDFNWEQNERIEEHMPGWRPKPKRLAKKAEFVIDLLIERPGVWINASFNRGITRQKRIHGPDVFAKSRVERIRINSLPLRDALADVMGTDVAPRIGQQILRPFKCILAYHEDLLKRRNEIKQEIAAGYDASDTTNASSTIDATVTSSEANANDKLGPSSLGIDNIGSSDTNERDDQQTNTVSSNNQEMSGDTEVQSSSATKADEASGVKLAKEDQELRLQHLEVLLSLLDHELKDDLEMHKRYRMREASSVRFEDLWHLFAPGDMLYCPDDSRAYQLLNVHNGRELLGTKLTDKDELEDGAARRDLLNSFASAARSSFVLDYFGVTFNGRTFGPQLGHLDIEPFDGEKRIADLPMFPMEYEATREMLKLNDEGDVPVQESLLQRGRKFADLSSALIGATRAMHCEYRGLTLDVVPEMVDSHVIVDTGYYYEKHPTQAPYLGFQKVTRGDPRELKRYCFACRSLDCHCYLRMDIHDDRKVEEERMETLIETKLGWLRQSGHHWTFEDKQLMLLPGSVWAFVLYSREWHPLDVNKLERVNKSSTSFDQLQITREHKILVESQVTMHSTGLKPTDGSEGSEDSDRREDLVRGKGKGLIILLHGAPGVGKTSTAECVAEYTGRPLLSITCGDIGDTAEEVSQKLEYFLNLAHRWGCVMLLDEADVFLASRDKRDLKRNAVVSVFLRILEYYSGILFLTTNKVGLVDEAFKSRIHLSLYYPALNRDQTKAIWSINLKRIKDNKPALEFSEPDIVTWAATQWEDQARQRKQPWNGRQIRNACQTAAALAEFESQGKLNIGHLQTVAKASSEFDLYLKDVHGGDDAQRAKRNHERQDNQVPFPYEDGYAHHERDSHDRYHPYDSYEPRERYDRAEYGAPDRRMSAYGGRRPQRDDYYRPREEERYDVDRRAPRAEPYDDYDRGQSRAGADMPPPPRPSQFGRESERYPPEVRRDAPPDARPR